MAVYDENILKNPFYLALEKQRPDLCSRVAEVHGVVLVPCCGSLSASSYTAVQFESYVLLPAEQGFQTVDGKEVSIENNQVHLVTGFVNPASIAILFEETFYNEKEQAYSILCIARPVDSEPSAVELSPGPAHYCLKNLEEAKDFLGRHAEKLDKFIAAFCTSFKEQERKSLRHHIDAVHTLYTKCLQCLLRDSRLVLTKQELQMTLLKQAVEMYIHDDIHEHLFSYVGTLEATQDAAFNKTTRGLQELQQKDLGVKSEFSINIPRAKRELSQLNRCSSPQQKLLCLRKVAFTIMQSPSRRVHLEAVCADDLLSVILYLLVKTEIPNWMANLSYIKNFHFCNSTKDELSYCLTSFEAAVEYISQGNLRQGQTGSGELNDKLFFRQKMNLLSQSSSTPIDCLFEHIANGNKEEVQRLLSEGESEEDRRPMCHPLCSCDACDQHLSGRLNDPSIVTPCSRDDRGYTPLHVAAICGQSLLTDLLMSKGAAVNATDYHGFTALHLSCQKGYQGVTLLLLHYQANTDAQDNNGNTPLHLACMYGHEDCVKALVYYDLHTCRLNVQNDKGDTALHIAARWGYEGIMEVLLENGASTLLHNKANQSPLHCALNSRVLSLLERTYNCASKEAPCHSPQPADSRRTSVTSTSSFIYVEPKSESDRPHIKEVEKLLRAVADGDVEMVRYLFEWMDTELEDDERAELPKNTELCHPLCQCPKCEPTQKKLFLLQSDRLGVNCSSADGFTPLHVAALHGHTGLVSLLIRHGANIDACNSQNATPLHLACQNSHTQVVSSLVECNAKLNKKDQFGNTPLIQSCLKGHEETVSVLIQSGASLNLANNQGNTALHEAVRGAHQGLVELLLQAGALTHLRNKRQRTALDCAQETNIAILRILQKACASSVEADSVRQFFIAQRHQAKAPSVVQHKSPDMQRIQQMTKSRHSATLLSTDSPYTGSDDLNYRRRLRRGETVDGFDLFIHTTADSHSFNQAKSLNRSHTIHQDLTHSCPVELEHTQCSSTADTMADPTDLSPEPEQVIGKTIKNMQTSLEEEMDEKEEEVEKEKEEEKMKEMEEEKMKEMDEEEKMKEMDEEEKMKEMDEKEKEEEKIKEMDEEEKMKEMDEKEKEEEEMDEKEKEEEKMKEMDEKEKEEKMKTTDEEEDQNKGKNTHWFSTEMENIVL
ncbi:ankyrin repeat domain-containing protein 27 isoform X2 [Tachysurus fulvidraco]|uniref:ankyrin repeat domain-containing protein 27 isoform X2 n=1 Tax=Tachysurus fulvidraco TaxID=1234273 RepID=UPI001FEEA8A8|nr:ankyrin repeat domain-containing protein 27 isoform X2 [Tachysurus fulvidraco]